MLSRPPLSHPSRPVPPAPNSRPTTSIYPVFLGMYPPGILAPASPHQKLLPDAQVGGILEWFCVRDNEYLAGDGLSGFSLLSLYPRGGELRRPAFSLPCLSVSERQETWTATCVGGWDWYHPMSTGCATQRWSSGRSC
jgi:hypothetical protein